MTRYVTLLLLLTSGCLPATYKAGVRRQEGRHLSQCMRYAPISGCVQESVERCRAQGLESSCGSDATWGR